MDTKIEQAFLECYKKAESILEQYEFNLALIKENNIKLQMYRDTQSEADKHLLEASLDELKQYQPDNSNLSALKELLETIEKLQLEKSNNVHLEFENRFQNSNSSNAATSIGFFNNTMESDSRDVATDKVDSENSAGF